jgi:hypothetical protein
MAQDSGLMARGLVVLGLMLILAAVVSFVLFRPGPDTLRAAEIPKIPPSADGWEVRYNATVALARRGSSKLPCDVIAEMLDERQQLRNHVDKTSTKDVEILDEQAARRAVANALLALTIWHKNSDAVKAVTATQAEGLQRVYAAVDKLLESDSAGLRQEARKFKEAIKSE